MSYSQRMRANYAALIVFARAWRESYRLGRSLGCPHRAALEFANIRVTLG